MAAIDRSDLGVIGLAVMGQNLALNLLDHGYRVSVYNRTVRRTTELLERSSHCSGLEGHTTIESFVASLACPRRILLMVKAGAAVDEAIASLLPYLQSGDLLVDGGNSHYLDSVRRQQQLEPHGIHFVGCGISGGEEGARHGPSIMPGGSSYAKEQLLPIFQQIAARDFQQGSCCEWIGPGGSGHFVKMVHNGIEYGDMQLICEIYDLMCKALGANSQQCQALFEKWREGPLASYLIEITAQILAYHDSDGLPLLDKIVDEAGQKGTGRWSVEQALALGVPLTLISEAVFARQLSSQRSLRERMRELYPLSPLSSSGTLEKWAEEMERALYAAKVISYAQGLRLMSQASQEHGWQLDLSEIARIWSGGCIIRSRFLKDIYEAYAQESAPIDLLAADFVRRDMPQAIESLRKVLSLAIAHSLPTAALSSALAYFDALRATRLPTALLQAQRDYFGAHTYQRIDRPDDQFFHTDWAQTGGAVSSTRYNA